MKRSSLGFITPTTTERARYSFVGQGSFYEATMVVTGNFTQAQLDDMSKPEKYLETLAQYRVCDSFSNGTIRQFFQQNALPIHRTPDIETCFRLLREKRMDLSIQTRDLLLHFKETQEFDYDFLFGPLFP